MSLPLRPHRLAALAAFSTAAAFAQLPGTVNPGPAVVNPAPAVVNPAPGAGATGAPGPGRVMPGTSTGGGLGSPAPFPGGLPSPAPGNLASPVPGNLPSPQPFPGGVPSPTITAPGTVSPGGADTAAPTVPPITDPGVAPGLVPGAPGVGRVEPPLTPGARTVPAPLGPFTAVDVARSFMGADIDSNGELTRAEAQFLTFAPLTFEQMDRNGDGRVSRFEYEDALGLR